MALFPVWSTSATFAPASISSSAICSLPLKAAAMSGVTPFLSAIAASAPAVSSVLTAGMRPLVAAASKAVTPFRLR